MSRSLINPLRQSESAVADHVEITLGKRRGLLAQSIPAMLVFLTLSYITRAELTPEWVTTCAGGHFAHVRNRRDPCRTRRCFLHHRDIGSFLEYGYHHRVDCARWLDPVVTVLGESRIRW